MSKTVQPFLQIKNLSKSFGENKVIQNVSFSASEGDVLAIIGSSGSGKTTLMNILTKSIDYDSGEIEIAGKNISEIRQSKEYAKYIGIIRQQFDLVRELEVIHNVLAGRLNEWGFWTSLQSLIRPKDQEKALKALDEVGIKDKAYEITANLSGGEQQRVALARLLIQDPDIFLADEPIASLDPARSDSILQLLTGLAKENNKVLIASMHSVDYVKKYFDRVIGLKEGQIVFDEKVSHLTDDTLEQLYLLQKGSDAFEEANDYS